jgi:hypothetical protein
MVIQLLQEATRKSVTQTAKKEGCAEKTIFIDHRRTS